MRARLLLSLLPLGAALAGAASAARAQLGARILVCRDGAQIAARDGRACDGHRGVDARATAYVRQQNLGGYPNAGYPNGGYRNHGQEIAAERHAEHDARRDARLRAKRRDDRRDDWRDDRRDERRRDR